MPVPSQSGGLYDRGKTDRSNIDAECAADNAHIRIFTWGGVKDAGYRGSSLGASSNPSVTTNCILKRGVDLTFEDEY